MHLHKPAVGKKEVATSACIVMLSLTACKSGGGGSLGGLGGGIGASTSSSPSGGGGFSSGGSLSRGSGKKGRSGYGSYSGGSLSSEHTSSNHRHSYSERDAARSFIIKNYKVLKVQAVRGEGEMLDALLELILEDEADIRKMARRLKKYSKAYFPNDKEKGADKILRRADKYNA